MPRTLLPMYPAEAAPINELVSFRKRDGAVCYFPGCPPTFTHAESDLRSFRPFTAQLAVGGNCTRAEETARGRRPGVFRQAVEAAAACADPGGVAAGAEAVVRGAATPGGGERLGDQTKTKGPTARRGMGMACIRVVERVCAAARLLGEAPSRFGQAESVARGGALWALPAAMALARVKTLVSTRRGVGQTAGSGPDSGMIACRAETALAGSPRAGGRYVFTPFAHRLPRLAVIFIPPVEFYRTRDSLENRTRSQAATSRTPPGGGP
jgi:hypothetical protein